MNRVILAATLLFAGALHAQSFRPSTSGTGPVFTSSAGGSVPASGGGTVNFLRADGTWAVPPGAGSAPGGSDTEFQYRVNSTTFGGVTGLTYNSTSKLVAYAPTSPTDHVLQITAGSLASGKNALQVSGTLSATAAQQVGAGINITTAGSGSNQVVGTYYNLGAGYTGTGESSAAHFENATAGTGTALVTALAGVFGAQGIASADSTGTHVGLMGHAENGDINIGVFGNAYQAGGAEVVIGVGGSVGAVNPTLTASTAIFATNTTFASNIIDAYDNTTSVWRLADGGTVTSTPVVDDPALTLVGTGVTTDRLLDLQTKNTESSLGIFRIAFPSATTQTGTIIGLFQNLHTNFTPLAGSSITGYAISTPTASFSSGSTDYATYTANSGGSLTVSGTGAMTWTGYVATIPALVQTAGTVSGVGFKATNSTLTTGGTYIAFNAPSTGVGAGSLTAFNAANITGGAGSETAIKVGTGWDVGIDLADVNVKLSATTGTKFGTATSEKLAFFNSTPVVQQAAIADATGGAVIDAECRTAVNAVITRLETFGFIAP